MPGGCEQNDMLLQCSIIVLLIFLVWRISNMERLVSTSGYVGHGLPAGVYTSGADLRFSPQFSSTDQGHNPKQLFL
jgi:hypothetical protein